MNKLHAPAALLLSCLAISACVPPAATQDGTQPSARPAADADKKVAQAPAEPLPAIDMPRYAVGDSCTYDRTVNGKRQKETRVVSAINNERMLWTSTMEKGGSSPVEFDANSMDLYADVALANNQKISFSAPYRWADFPLSAGKSWETAAVVKGESFTADVKTKASVGKWEKLKVPAGEFDALKVTWKEQIVSNGSRGSGTLSYWISRDSKCLLKVTYSNSWGERGQSLLVAASH